MRRFLPGVALLACLTVAPAPAAATEPTYLAFRTPGAVLARDGVYEVRVKAGATAALTAELHSLRTGKAARGATVLFAHVLTNSWPRWEVPLGTDVTNHQGAVYYRFRTLAGARGRA